MTQLSYLIIGQGDIGLPVTNQLANLGMQVTGLARGARSEYELSNKAKFMQADALDLTAEQIQSFTHIAIVVTPDTYDADAYKNTYYAIAKHIASLMTQLSKKNSCKLQRIVFISSSGVYGQDNGEWIDETVAPETPKRQGSQYILAAEQVLQDALDERSIIIRPSGIYGKQRLMRIRKVQEQQQQQMPPYAWTNRIMDSDLIDIIVNVLTADKSKLKPIYIASDYCPVTSYELSCWLCDKLQLQRPQLADDNKAPNQASAANFTNVKSIDSDSHDTRVMIGKRLHSNIPREWLKYPDWQVGYEMILQSLNKI